MYKTRKGRLQRKVLDLLLAGVALGMTRSPRTYFYIVGEVVRELKGENKQSIERSLKALRDRGYVRMKKNRSGSWYPELTAKGREEAKKFVSSYLTFPKSKKWDGRWRVISYDIPEEEKWKRQAICMHLKHLGCREMHQSVFVYPYDCIKELEELVKMLELSNYVYLMVAYIKNDKKLKGFFSL